MSTITVNTPTKGPSKGTVKVSDPAKAHAKALAEASANAHAKTPANAHAKAHAKASAEASAKAHAKTHVTWNKGSTPLDRLKNETKTTQVVENFDIANLLPLLEKFNNINSKIHDSIEKKDKKIFTTVNKRNDQ